MSMVLVSCDKEDSNSIPEPVVAPEPLMHNGHEYVDLGLTDEYSHPIYWATCNVGANKPEDYGGYFAWGETEEKTAYNKDNYKYMQNWVPTKYNGEDEIPKLEAADDAASVNWGGLWRTPTRMDFFLLYQYCTWTLMVKDGITGYNVVGKNGNSIFLPCAGLVDEWGKASVGTATIYWTSLANYDIRGKYGAWSFSLMDDGNLNWVDIDKRYAGQPVRPVFNPAE